MFLCSYSQSPLCCMALTPRWSILLECHHSRHRPHLCPPLHVQHLSSLIRPSLALHAITQHLLLHRLCCWYHEIEIASLLSQTSCPDPGQDGTSGPMQYSHPDQASTPQEGCLGQAMCQVPGADPAPAGARVRAPHMAGVLTLKTH
jgi:hypothetical protein